MKRTTIFMPEELESELREYATRQKQPVAWVVREAVSAYLASHEQPLRLPLSIGMGDSGRSDISEREDLVFADLTPDDDRVRLPRRSSQEPSGAKAGALPRRSSRAKTGSEPRRRARAAKRASRR